MLGRLPAPIRRWLYAGGSRQDRLRDPDRVVDLLDVRPGHRVADLGPGMGHFTLRLARAVAPGGLVYALDIDRETLGDIERAAAERGLTTLRAVPVGRHRLDLPEPVDLLFVSATYHHLADPVAYFSDARRYLRRDGRLAILESRGEGLLAGRMGRHATPSDRVRRQMHDAGFELRTTHDVATGHWFGVFEVAADGRLSSDRHARRVASRS